MKILVQKVLNASVNVNQQLVSQIDRGFLLFIGVEKGDTHTQADFLTKKLQILGFLKMKTIR